MTACFHCGETVPKGCHLTAEIAGQEQPMCCIGCQAVALFLADNDHEVFYQYRQGQLPAEQVGNKPTSWQHLDAKDVFSELTQVLDDETVQVTIKVEGMYCSACGWLLQKVLADRPGIRELRINTVTQNLQVEFNPKLIKLSEIFAQIETLGYQPMQQNSSENPADEARKDQLKKIAVAGFGMMFIMTLAVPLYSPEDFTVAPHIQRFFLMISMLIATAVYFYSGMSFVNNAIRDLRNRHLGMDVPVALSISLAYFVSIYLSFKQQGHVYFDSMTMFIFFLLLGRYVESQVKHQGMNVRESLFALIPVSAIRLNQGTSETVPLNQINKGDQLLVKAGETIPCDGVVDEGQGQVNEAILTGESQSLNKGPGDTIYAGATLQNGQLVFTTSVNNQNSFLAKLADLMELAQSKKPASLQLVDQIASYFVAGVLFLALATTIWYGMNQSDALMTALLAVLIATCPCALSLATPTALTASGVHLLRQGILVNNTDAITRLAKTDRWFFDKTGTLTEDKLSIHQQHILTDYDKNKLLQICSSLQQVSNHPIASAFQYPEILPVINAKELAGRGVSGQISDETGAAEWHMGSRHWLQSLNVAIPQIDTDSAYTQILLAKDRQVVAVFELDVPVRAGTKKLLKHLQKVQKPQAILSGDNAATVAKWATKLSIKEYHGELKAEQKINHLAAQQQAGAACVMVGDGVNDAPVLSQADVSISLKQGAHLAHSASDMIVLGKSLAPVVKALDISSKTHAIIKQNLIWSLVYNLSVTPVAMMGLLAPWMAAIGMSLSSLLVVFNSRRLLK
ncbi:heavy metal translocating P-type ATPase [Marinicella sp. S1101]|uniref:heavy metal translocating P-type ATPase n=1 Tax=Marinicella marina TaxID=2996016 RepID=UPI0022609D9B|nr:heavy metal translocating P-type ATPase [Marinicella marina]MCX7553314.1 heavy metal translocating P-type ATPase [Marinicella marina]MDJ1139046.1 heavy metal translocating P-type ATPase [Marinicella marina]